MRTEVGGGDMRACPRRQLQRFPPNIGLEPLHLERDGEDIACLHLPAKVLRHRRNEREQFFGWLRYPFSLKPPVIAEMQRLFSVSGWKIEVNCHSQVIAHLQRTIHILLVDRRYKR